MNSTLEVPEVINKLSNIDSSPNASSLTAEPAFGKEIVSSKHRKKNSFSLNFSILQNTTYESSTQNAQNTLEQEIDQQNVLDVRNSSYISLPRKDQFVSN